MLTASLLKSKIPPFFSHPFLKGLTSCGFKNGFRPSLLKAKIIRKRQGDSNVEMSARTLQELGE